MAKEKSLAVVVNQFGGYDNITIEDFNLPALDENIEVEVEYGGVNFADIYTRQGLRNVKCPFVMGIECTGKITAIGEKVLNPEFKLGQSVICYDIETGLYREKVRVNPKQCFALPDHINTKDGCAVFVNYLTAWFSVIDLGRLRSNEKILIQSCAGGVGIAATQIAKTIEGVQVYGIGSRFKKDKVIGLGVDKYISNDEIRSEIGDDRFDVIIANQSGDLFTYLQDLLKPLGRIIILGANNAIKEDKLDLNELMSSQPISAESLIMNNRVVAGIHLGVLLAQCRDKLEDALKSIFEMLKDGKLIPVIDSVWPMSQVIEANKRLSERKNVGKVLIKITDS